MQDDFAALDLLSVGNLTPASFPARKKKKRFGTGGKTAKSRELTVLLPLIREKLRPLPSPEDLQGWPVTLSWPGQDQPAPRGLPVTPRRETVDAAGL